METDLSMRNYAVAVERTVKTGRRHPIDSAALSCSLERILGSRMVAVITNAPDTETVHDWSTGKVAPGPAVQKRLRDAAKVTETLLAVESPETVQAWFVGTNPVLEGRAPALMMATDPERVLLAARYFVANG